MIYITSASKVLIISLLLRVIVLCVEPIQIKNVYLLPYKDESFSDYQTRGKNGDTNMTDDKILDEKQFYQAVYNLEVRRIPEVPPGFSNSYSYGKYVETFRNYCNNVYITYDVLKRQEQIAEFKGYVRTFNACLEVCEEDPGPEIHRSKHDLLLKTKIAPCLERVKQKDRKKCLKENLSEKQISQMYKCSVIFARSMSESKKLNEPVNPKDRKKCLKFSPADHVDHIGKFVGFAVNTVFKPALLKNSNSLQQQSLSSETMISDVITMNLNLLKSVINENFRHSNKMLGKILADFREVKVLVKSAKDARECLKLMMTQLEYTETKLLYSFMPNLEDIDFESFKEKRKNIIMYLKDIDRSKCNAAKLYDKLLTKTDDIDQEYFIELKKTRAIKSETLYLSYAVRLLKQNVLPLPKRLWNLEQYYEIENKNATDWDYLETL